MPVSVCGRSGEQRFAGGSRVSMAQSLSQGPMGARSVARNRLPGMQRLPHQGRRSLVEMARIAISLCGEGRGHATTGEEKENRALARESSH